MGRCITKDLHPFGLPSGTLVTMAEPSVDVSGGAAIHTAAVLHHTTGRMVWNCRAAFVLKGKGSIKEVGTLDLKASHYSYSNTWQKEAVELMEDAYKEVMAEKWPIGDVVIF
ncbi:hypothetical protein B0T26DRAFT_403660 [Lasiosphaeria miniovina]|uniref:Uncharacterized protein n=1 Tax=Lasiosphaeria miniovina TaxID=1954250 RepID=A0AA40DN79_9PEZI|nr:uncharacterized protein B0T26DRAFT_403660 [Lasiosphaeria miniovina]KAK0709370.1 hypothetical protein B0T26DRAFT_403660 [Lasiosphaeria miniovina]